MAHLALNEGFLCPSPDMAILLSSPTHLPLSYTLSAHTDIARSDIMKLKLLYVSLVVNRQ